MCYKRKTNELFFYRTSNKLWMFHYQKWFFVMHCCLPPLLKHGRKFCFSNTRLLIRFLPIAFTVLTDVRSRSEILLYIPEKWCGHEDCSFDNRPLNVLPEIWNFFASSPIKFSKKHFFWKQIFSKVNFL